MAQTISDSAKQPSNNSTGGNLSSVSSAPISGQLKTGTGFTNLQNYLSANQNNQLGQTVTSGVQGLANTLGQDTSAQQNTFNTQAQQAYQPFSNGQQTIQNALASPTSVTSNPTSQSQWNQLYSGQYNGPTGLANQGQLLGEQQNIQNVAGLGNTSGGQQQLLDTFVGGPGYGTGASSLDQVLLGNSLNNGTLQGIATQSNKALTAANAQANNTAQQYQNQAQALGQQAQQGVAQAQANQNAAVQNQLTQAQNQQANASALYAQTIQNMQNGTATQAEIAAVPALQAALASNPNLYNLNLSSYLQNNTGGTPTAQNVATQQQAINLNALGALAGQTTPAYNLSQAGTYNPAGVGFNTSQFQTDQSTAANAVQGLQGQMQNSRMLMALLYPQQAAQGGIDVNENVANATNKYGSTQAAIAALGGDPTSNQFGVLRETQDNLQNQINAYDPNNVLNIVPTQPTS